MKEMFKGEDWKVIKMDIPKEIQEVYDIFCELQKRANFKFCIAGGCLSNIYLGKKWNDIDVFLELQNGNYEEFYKTCQQYFEDLKSDDMYPIEQVQLLWKGLYNDSNVEMVFCAKMEKILDFDLTFRKFYYADGEVFAATDALEEIEKKVLTISSPLSPITTWIRMHHFKEEFGFSIEQKSEDVLLYMMSQAPYRLETIKEHLKRRKNLNPKAKEYIVSKIEQYTNQSSVHFPEKEVDMDPLVLELLQKVKEVGIKRNLIISSHEDTPGPGIMGKLYKKTLTNVQFKQINETISYSWSKDFRSKIEFILTKELDSFIKKARLRSLVESSELFQRFFRSIIHIRKTMEFSYPGDLVFDAYQMKYYNFINEKEEKFFNSSLFLLLHMLKNNEVEIDIRSEINFKDLSRFLDSDLFCNIYVSNKYLSDHKIEFRVYKKDGVYSVLYFHGLNGNEKYNDIRKMIFHEIQSDVKKFIV